MTDSIAAELDDISKDVDDMTEIVDAHIPRVDLVGRAANGTRFLIAKGEEGASLLGPDQVAELITKEESPMTDTAPAADVAEGSVAKADLAIDDIIADSPGGGTADTVPGSPDWEIRDAETAANAIGVLSRVRAVLEWLRGREAQEAAGGEDPRGMWQTEDAGWAVEDAIAILAPYAAGEAIEAELTDELEVIGKALALIDDRTLTFAETVAPIVKAGRVLSGKNETLLREAGERLNTVLAALPAADPVEKKETAVSDDNTNPEAEVVKTDGEDTPTNDAPEVVEKAEAMTAVFDQNGTLIGAVKPAAIVPLDGGAKPKADEPEADDLEPADPAEVGVDADEPADEVLVEKGAEGTAGEGDTVADLVKSAEEGDDPLAKRLAAELTARDEELAKLLKAPAPGGPIANGGPLPSATNMRGQDSGASVAPDASKVADLKKAAAMADTPAEREAARDELTKLAAAQLGAIRAAGPSPR